MYIRFLDIRNSNFVQRQGCPTLTLSSLNLITNRSFTIKEMKDHQRNFQHSDNIEKTKELTLVYIIL